MQLNSTQLTGLIGAVTLYAGLASSVAFADDSKQSDEPAAKSVEDSHESDQSTKAQSPSEQPPEGMVEVRISMPDGRTIIRYERARQSSVRQSVLNSSPNSRILADGSRISYARAGGSSVSGSAQVRVGSSGGGGGAASSGSSASGSSERSGGGSGGGSASSSSGSGGGGQSASSGLTPGSTVATFSKSGSSTQAADAEAADSSSSSSESRSGSSSTQAPRSVHTVGGARHNESGAIGGQRVEFHDAGMGAAVIGNTVYFTGVQLIQADQSFEVLVGTRLGADSVIMQEGRLDSSGNGPLSSWDTGSSPIKLEFERDTIVELVMFSEPENSITPDRVQRTWTVRIR